MKNIYAIALISLSFLIISCNPEGIGIFFQVSEEVALNDSNISGSQVFQVLEIGSTVYALAGSSVWKQTASNWSDISGSNYMYSIFEYSGSLYSVVNNDLNNLSAGKTMVYDGTAWTQVSDYGANITIFESDSTYILNKRVSSTNSIGSSADPSVTITINESITENIIDGASNGSSDLLISQSAIYGTVYGSLASITFNPATTLSGNFSGLTYDASGKYYLTSSTGQVYGSVDNGTSWTFISDIAAVPVSGSLAVITLNSKEFLIIGTENAYYEMNITDSGTIVPPTTTVVTTDFTATYPDLANELIFKIYQSAAGAADNSTGNYFYLATSKGLWKRVSDGTFQRQ